VDFGLSARGDAEGLKGNEGNMVENTCREATHKNVLCGEKFDKEKRDDCMRENNTNQNDLLENSTENEMNESRTHILPNLSQIDESFLWSLPLPIRKEIELEYRNHKTDSSRAISDIRAMTGTAFHQPTTVDGGSRGNRGSSSRGRGSRGNRGSRGSRGNLGSGRGGNGRGGRGGHSELDSVVGGNGIMRQQTLIERGCQLDDASGVDMENSEESENQFPFGLDMEMVMSLPSDVLWETLTSMGWEISDVQKIFKMKERKKLERNSVENYEGKSETETRCDSPQQYDQIEIPPIVRETHSESLHQTVIPQNTNIPHKILSNQEMNFNHIDNEKTKVTQNLDFNLSDFLFRTDKIDSEFRKVMENWMAATACPSPLHRSLLSLFLHQLFYENKLESLHFALNFISRFAGTYLQWKEIVMDVVNEVMVRIRDHYGAELRINF
jgi:hypothetical protein